MATLQSITDASHFASAISSIPDDSLTILYFHTAWATPCAQMTTVLSTLASTYPASASSPAFLSVDAEELPDVADDYDVTAVPFIVLRRGHRLLESISGGDATKVRAAVEKHAGAGGSSKTQLPPAQQVTHRQQETAAQAGSNGGDGAANLSAYAPSSKDPATAPEFSSSTLAATKNEDLQTRLAELVKAAPCMLFMKGTPSAPQCGFSRQLVSILREQGVRYGFFNILADEEIRQGLKEFADWPTFPQLWMGGELVGGLDIVKEECEADPDFFAQYAVEGKGRNRGGPAAPEMQAQPVEA